MNKWNIKGHHRRKKKRETRKNLCVAWTSKLKECLGGIEKALETLKECDPNPARSCKVAHDVEKSVKIYQEICDEKTRKTKQSTRSSSQSNMPSLSHLPTLLQLAPPHPLPTVLQLALPPYPLSSKQ
ncbi:hypothetical protein E2C01_064209 [Portunus trituberculatus]|uniref:Uncharacterized protein n=1 Tax=Portunus trituberculatus TaxID=210409 RepID=A0A5B7HK74_PORTR|nr:hypothetical protein [Portunus trituberculatus]